MEINKYGPEEYSDYELISISELRCIRRIWVFEKHEFDDAWKGIFDSEEERFNYLYKIAKIIKKKISQELLEVFKGENI